MKSHAKTRSARKPAITPVRRQPKPAQVIRLPVQPALQVGAVSDPAEREAETMAARVVGASAPAPVSSDAGTAPNGSNPVAALRRSTEDQPNLDELAPEPPGAEQQDFDLPSTQDVSPEGLDAADMSELESGKPDDVVSALRRDAGPQAAVGRMGGEAPSDVTAMVARPGPGRPLPSGLRARVEPHFGRDFSDVRLHDAPADQTAAARIGARAFTHKNRIWLGKGESPTNTRLMAHELTHVVQQTDGAERLPINRDTAARDVVQREPIRREEDEGYIAGKLEGYARYVPGYTLATVILGKKLIAGTKVARTAENLLGGLFGLHPLGTVLFDKLRETRMVQEGYDWTVQRLGELNLTWSRVSGIVDKIWDAPWTGTKEYIIGLFRPIVTDLITFAKDVGQKVLEFAVRGALKLAGPYADKVWAIIEQARDVINLIIEDPLQFVKNLIKAIVGGFGRFVSNIFEHLKKGLLGWLFGAIAGAGITMPEKLDFKGLMSLVMQILGLTYANFRKELVKKLGPSGERKVAMIEKSVEIVTILLKEGFAGIWQKMLEMIENFKTTLIGGISSMVITTVVKAGLSWLAGLSNPIGGIVKVCLGIYDMIVAFLERLEQIMDVAKSIFSSVGAIARGQTEAASKFVEETIGRTVPVVIAFLAAALGLGGISAKIKGVIDKLQAPVKKAMGKLIGFVLKKMKKLFAKIIGKLNKKRKLPVVPFKVGDTPHEMHMIKDGKRVKYMIASKVKHEKDKVSAASKKALERIEMENAKKEAGVVEKEVADFAARMESHEAIDMSSEKKPTQKPVEKSFKTAKDELEDVSTESATLVDEVGLTTQTPDDDPSLFRDKPARIFELEGEIGTYDTVADAKKTILKEKRAGEDVFKQYELDHVVEKKFAIHILNNLDKLDPHRKRSGGDILRDLPETEKGNQKVINREAENDGQRFGMIGSGMMKKIDPAGGPLPVIATFKMNHKRVAADKDVSAADLVEAAINAPTGQNPHTILREGLQKQLDAELQSVANLITNDTTAEENIKTKIMGKLPELATYNKNLFELGAQADKIEANSTTVNDTEAKMKGGAKTPAFQDIEGKGSPYDAAPKGIAGFLENDHVVDKAYPKAIAPLKLVDPAKKAELDAQVLALANVSKVSDLPSAVAGRRRKILGRDLFFGKNHPVRLFKDTSGWSIPLYKPLADRVTAKTREDPDFDGLAKTGASSAMASLADYIVNGGDGTMTSAIDTARSPVERELTRLTESHIDAIVDEYAQELPTVKKANPDRTEEAAAAFKSITGRVAGSLQKARAQTLTFLD